MKESIGITLLLGIALGGWIDREHLAEPQRQAHNFEGKQEAERVTSSEGQCLEKLHGARA
ncbi:MAG: hypothetical protein OXD30_13040 [Bryobacterales bacterium]|nr:hypothetical protein [Bryobacterales bacterium]